MNDEEHLTAEDAEDAEDFWILDYEDSQSTI